MDYLQQNNAVSKSLTGQAKREDILAKVTGACACLEKRITA